MSFAIPDPKTVNFAKRLDWERAQRVYFASSPSSLPTLFTHYVEGVGCYDDWTWFQIRRKIDSVAVLEGLIAEGGSVFDPALRIRKEHLEAVCPAYSGAYYDIGPASLVTSLLVLEEGPNEYQDLSLPSPPNNLLGKVRRPALRLHAIDDADLYLHPLCYQVFKERESWFYPSASSRSCSRISLEQSLVSAPSLPDTGTTVIIQDRFPGRNFAHFLFDWITRIGLFCESGVEDLRDCVFALGGAPGRFETLLLEALASEYDLSEEQFLFPSHALVLRRARRLYWFSDQVESYLHPAQMAHPRSVDIIRRVAARVPRAPTRFKRIYISRSDAPRRRLSNEGEICRALILHGFEPVVLSDFSVEDQISIVTGADCVVSPHGMGMTHLALHPGTPAVLEIHQPGSGTDAYAFMAKAMGCHYEFAVGEIGNSWGDYTVQADAVLSAIERLDLGMPSSVHDGTYGNARVGNPENTHPEAGQLDADTTGSPQGLPLNCGDSIMRHVRADPEVFPDTNVAAWYEIDLEPGRLYTATCWVWIPEAFRGTHVELNVGEWPSQRRIPADVQLREQWQQISATRTCPPDRNTGHVVLRVVAPGGDIVFSTG